MSTGIPAMSQSKQALLACPFRYCSEVIHGQKQVTGEAGRRGSAIHRFLQDYVGHLVKTRQTRDEVAFDNNLRGMDPAAREILEPLRETLTIDPEVVFATEQKIGLTEAFTVTPAGLPGAAYEMTLDLVELHEETLAKIVDYKSQFQAIDPDTVQARLYSLGVFMLNPQIEQVEFCLKFLRWGKVRSVTFSREQVPELQKEMAMWRERQLALHKEQNAVALPGSHCIYCPLLAKSCPIENNPAATPEDSLRKVLYFKEALKEHSAIVRTWADEHGALRVEDGVGQKYEAAWGIGETKKFGLDCLPMILEWCKRTKDDIMGKLSISGLATPLKARKRNDLADELANLVEVQTKPRFKIGKVDGEEEEDDAPSN